MLFFKFFQREVCSSLVVTHVVVPCLRELKELGFLSSFDILEFLLLSSSDVVFLTDSFFPQKLVKLAAGLFGFLVVAFDFALSTVLFEKPQEVQYFVVSRYANDALVGL